MRREKVRNISSQLKSKGEASLALLDILCCALGALIVVFLIFSLFNRVGTVTQLKSDNEILTPLVELENEEKKKFDVRMYELKFSGCEVDSLSSDQKKAFNVSLLIDGRILVLVKKEGEILPIVCRTNGSVQYTILRAPSIEVSGELSLNTGDSLEYTESGWRVSS